MNRKDIMASIKLEDVHDDIAKAIERQEYSAGSESVCEILQSTAQKESKYWREAAHELHRRQKFYEALDCWKEGEKYIYQGKAELSYWYEDMVRTLNNATDQSGDIYFCQQALETCIRVCKLNESEEIWNIRLQLEIQLQFDIEKILTYIEHMLDKGFCVEGVSGCLLGNGYIEQVHNYEELAQCYLVRKDVGEALRIWAKAIKNDKSKTNQILCNTTYWLIIHADKNDLNIDDYLPDNFKKIK